MTKTLQSIAVFCGASEGFNTLYQEMAYEVGQVIARNGIRVVYGGARAGLMGAVAYGALGAGGEVIGVLPHFLQTAEVAHPDLTALHVVDSMHERKLKMHELSDAVLVLPGGWGTMDELMEMLTWAQLGLHNKPICLLNTGGYYDGLLMQMERMEDEGFLQHEHARLLIVTESVHDLFEAIAADGGAAVAMS